MTLREKYGWSVVDIKAPSLCRGPPGTKAVAAVSGTNGLVDVKYGPNQQYPDTGFEQSPEAWKALLEAMDWMEQQWERGDKQRRQANQTNLMLSRKRSIKTMRE